MLSWEIAAGVSPMNAIEIVEVAPRDGLQNEKQLLATDVKLELIERAYQAGARRIEVTSFVHPERVPQMADAEAVVAGLTPHEDVVYTALVLNERGYDRALATGIREVNTVVITTETFSRRNQGMSVAESVAAVSKIHARAAADGVRATVTISAAFGCPFEGEVPLDTLTEVARQVAAIDADEIVLADTIGVAVPSDVEERIAAVRGIGARGALRGHFHNTRNTAVANVIAAVRSGVTAIDASLAGIGGCPFAPAATGNVATEDLVYALERMGYETGYDLERSIASARWIAGELGIEPPGMVARAGGFPDRG
jgi:hydroxymethylglutaryl-CoA lyase